jgi:Zn-dependent M28 family amino/carboxypeptidase
VNQLAGEIGERYLLSSLKLATATDYVATELEKYGYTVNRMGFMIGEDVAQNLEAVLPGKDASRPTLIVGAHYDTVASSPGADDNASGVAAVLELARLFHGKDLPGYVRFAFFPNEEAPYFQTESMGSLVYAKHLVADHLPVSAMLSIESIGYFSAAPGSQRYPKPLGDKYPNTGDFIAVVGNPQSADIVDQVRRSLRAHATIPFVADALPATLPGVAASDHWAFWTVGYKAVMITDTAMFRNPNYHAASDLPNTLDYEQMARVVAALEHVIANLAGMP